MTGEGISFLEPGREQAVWIFEELMEMKATGEDTGGAFALWVDTPLPGYGPPLHVHREDEYFLVLEGELVFRGADGERDAPPGTWVRIPRGTPHTFRNVGSTPAKLVVVVAPAGTERFFLEAGAAATDRSTPPPPNLERILELGPKYGTEVVEAGPLP